MRDEDSEWKRENMAMNRIVSSSCPVFFFFFYLKKKNSFRIFILKWLDSFFSLNFSFSLLQFSCWLLLPLAVKSQTVRFFRCVIWFCLNENRSFLTLAACVPSMGYKTTLNNFFPCALLFFFTMLLRLHRVVCGRITEMNELHFQFSEFSS